MGLLSRLLGLLRPPPAPSAAPIPGEITDWNELDGTGTVQLPDTAVLTFGRGACDGFQPLIGLHVEVLGVGMPKGEQPGALEATTLRVPADARRAYAEGLRAFELQQSARAARAGAAEPPGQGRRARRGDERPGDAFFVFTLLLERPLPPEPQLLADLLRSASLPWLQVRIIPLIRRGQAEPGFSAEIKDQRGRRAFLLYRPVPYEHEEAPYHAGLFVGGPHSPRLSQALGRQSGPPALSADGEVRWLADLLRSLLRSRAGVTGVVVNRAGGARKPAETAASQLGPEDRPGHLPVLPWIDWDLGELEGRRTQLSLGMESLGLPDVGVLLPEGAEDDEAVARSRDVLWWTCQQLAEGALPPEVTELEVPRGLTLQPGSELAAPEGAARERYLVSRRERDLLLLRPA